MYEISKRRVHAQPVELPLVKREVRLERVRSKVCLAFTPIHSMENNKFKVTLIRVFLFLKKVVFSFLPCYSQKSPNEIHPGFSSHQKMVANESVA